MARNRQRRCTSRRRSGSVRQPRRRRWVTFACHHSGAAKEARRGARLRALPLRLASVLGVHLASTARMDLRQGGMDRMRISRGRHHRACNKDSRHRACNRDSRHVISSRGNRRRFNNTGPSRSFRISDTVCRPWAEAAVRRCQPMLLLDARHRCIQAFKSRSSRERLCLGRHQFCQSMTGSAFCRRQKRFSKARLRLSENDRELDGSALPPREDRMSEANPRGWPRLRHTPLVRFLEGSKPSWLAHRARSLASTQTVDVARRRKLNQRDPSSERAHKTFTREFR